jgi:hypothetical protein
MYLSQGKQFTASTYNEISKLYFPKLKVGKIAKKIIELLISKKRSRSEIYQLMNDFFKIDKDYSRHFLWYLKSKGFIIENQNIFELTNTGKFIFLMSTYKINFVQLCFLLESFCYQYRMMKGGEMGFYGISQFVDKVEHVFTQEYVIWNVSHLSKKGLIYRHHKNAFSLMPRTFKELMHYHDIVESFHIWFIETWRKKRELILHDPLTLKRQHDYAELFQRISL